MSRVLIEQIYTHTYIYIIRIYIYIAWARKEDLSSLFSLFFLYFSSFFSFRLNFSFSSTSKWNHRSVAMVVHAKSELRKNNARVVCVVTLVASFKRNEKRKSRSRNDDECLAGVQFGNDDGRNRKKEGKKKKIKKKTVTRRIGQYFTVQPQAISFVILRWRVIDDGESFVHTFFTTVFL